MKMTFTVKCEGQLSVAVGHDFYARAGQYMVSSTLRKINGGIRPTNAPLTVAIKQGSRTLRDRGQLMSSISSRVEGDAAIIGTNHPGARLNHFGGTIHPKKGKWLWIPAGGRTRRLQRRYGFSATHIISGLKRDGYKVWMASRKKTSGAFMAQKGRGNPFVVFILKKSVTIPARPFLFVDDLDRDVLSRMLAQEVKR
ncbi:phage virion morphogenesis protein [Parasphaerochaeta coccoides]|uniref:Phage virion morphogenesis protein n=1 Tax=Parasphaerochaeta coccoides (strain ATCC BAA-1237 / DSM 17374 / SPN1) TaxID=760011 RepID=F4GHD7_PARC1|nr:phage virion morphogenesis protein [Parasphaerochaeta coccoides]AEC02036.1 hypothetical protein Spico_0811 [Parasphaerochaeta coccoides DSM 17374]